MNSMSAAGGSRQGEPYLEVPPDVTTGRVEVVVGGLVVDVVAGALVGGADVGAEVASELGPPTEVEVVVVGVEVVVVET